MRDFPDLIPSRKRRSHCCLSDKSFEPLENTAKKRVPALWARLNDFTGKFCASFCHLSRSIGKQRLFIRNQEKDKLIFRAYEAQKNKKDSQN